MCAPRAFRLCVPSRTLSYRALHGDSDPVHLSRLGMRPPVSEQRGRLHSGYYGRPRRSGDAGSPKADQKAGDEGSETETVSESESEAVSVAGTGTAVPAWSLRGVLEATDSLWIGQRDRHPPAVVGSHQGNRCHAGREGSQPLRRRPSHRLAHNAVPGSPGRRAPGQLSRLRSRPPGKRNPRPPPGPKPPSPNLERPPARGALIAEAIVVPPGPLGGLA